MARLAAPGFSIAYILLSNSYPKIRPPCPATGPEDKALARDIIAVPAMSQSRHTRLTKDPAGIAQSPFI
jgi:hypothetical protein